MQKKLLLALSALILFFTGCEEPKTLTTPFDGQAALFMNTATGEMAFYHGEENETKDLDALSGADKLNGTLMLFHYEDENETLAAYLKSDFNFSEGNATESDIIFVGHPDVNDNEAEPFHTDHNKTVVLASLNAELAEHNKSEAEVKEALDGLSGYSASDLCIFYAAHEEEGHDDHDEEEHEEISHFVVTKDAYVHFFKENNATHELQKYQEKSVKLIGASTCSEGNAGIAASTDGVYIYLQSTKTVYLIDAHHAEDAHEHTQWNISEFLSSTIAPTQMLVFGEGNHSH